MPTPTDNLSAGLPHSDAKLEDLMPGTINGTPLEKLSLPLSTYMASEVCSATNPCGDKALYTPWLVQFGKTPDDATLAVATDLTGTVKLLIHAFKVPGVTGAQLSAGFKAQALKADWPAFERSVALKSVVEIVDPDRQALALPSTAYVYVKNDVMFMVITDDPNLLVQALILLP